MKTISLPVIFGHGPDGPRAGRARIEIPETLTRNQLRRAALHGPENASDVGTFPYRLLLPQGTGWNIWGSVNVAASKKPRTKSFASWRDFDATDFFDSDGCNPDADDVINLMREYRDTGGVDGYFFVDTTKPPKQGTEDDDPLYWDEWHDEWRPAYMCGIQPDKIDWTGFPD